MGAAAERNLLSRDSYRIVSSLQEPLNFCKRLGEREATFLGLGSPSKGAVRGGDLMAGSRKGPEAESDPRRTNSLQHGCFYSG